MKTTEQHTQLQADVDLNDSGCSLDNCVIVGYVKPLAERTPEPLKVSLDTEESVRRKKKRKQQPNEFHCCSDSEPSRSSSPYCFIYSENIGRHRSCSSLPAEKMIRTNVK